MYMNSAGMVAGLRSQLYAAGTDVQHELTRGALVFASGDDHFLDGHFVVDRMIDVIIGEMNRTGPFDFADRAFVTVLRDQGVEIAADRATWHIPPIDTLFVQRKISGTALLAARLKVRVDVRPMVERYRETFANAPLIPVG